MSSPSPLTEDLAARIRAMRTKVLFLSQKEAAATLGVSERTLQAWEAGASFPQPKHRRAVAEFLGETRAA